MALKGASDSPHSAQPAPVQTPLPLHTQEHPDPEGFHLNIVATVAELYLSTETRYGRWCSPLAEAFQKAKLGRPDFALFWDYPWCAGRAPLPCRERLCNCVRTAWQPLPVAAL